MRVAVILTNTILAIILLLGTSYLVFVQGRSPAWFVGAMLAYGIVSHHITGQRGDDK